MSENRIIVDANIESAATNIPPGRVPKDMPFFISTSQAYFWTPEWQQGEREAQAEIDRGETMRFETSEEAIRWLEDW